MKINPMHSVQAYKKLQESQQKQNDGKSARADQVQISSEAKEMAKQKGIPPERQEKINDVKAKIDNGTYKINHNEVARKIYDFWNQ